MAVALDEPLKVTVAPLPFAGGVIEPEMENVGTATAVKLVPVTLAPLMVTALLVGVKVNPVLLGVTT